MLKRLEQLTKIGTNLLNEDMGNRIYQKSIRKIKQEFPQANDVAIRNLSKLILKDEAKLTPSIFHKLGYVRSRMCNSELKYSIINFSSIGMKSSEQELSFFKRKRHKPKEIAYNKSYINNGYGSKFNNINYNGLSMLPEIKIKNSKSRMAYMTNHN